MTVGAEMIVVRDDGFTADDLAPASFLPVDQIDWCSAESACVEIASDADPSSLRDRFAQIHAIRVKFDDSADGRGFSIAARLRRLGYRGRLRAHGHLIADQFRLARRSGFDEVAISQAMSERQPERQWIARAPAPSYQQRLIGGSPSLPDRADA